MRALFGGHRGVQLVPRHPVRAHAVQPVAAQLARARFCGVHDGLRLAMVALRGRHLFMGIIGCQEGTNIQPSHDSYTHSHPLYYLASFRLTYVTFRTSCGRR